jgi:hypothetical protein
MKPKATNVKHHLKHIIWSIDSMLENDGKYEGGTRLAPIDQSNLKEIRFFSNLILKKHESKNTRKDIYIEKR